MWVKSAQCQILIKGHFYALWFLRVGITAVFIQCPPIFQGMFESQQCYFNESSHTEDFLMSVTH